MTHWLTALIGETEMLRGVCHELGTDRLHDLEFGLSLLPLSHDAIDKLRGNPDSSDPVPSFDYLTSAFLEDLSRRSKGSRLAYIETRYCGGTGDQGAIAFENGVVTFGPETADIGPINRALARLGVQITPPAIDEFASLNLVRFRSTEDALDPYAGPFT
jgi:hypothetical protein